MTCTHALNRFFFILSLTYFKYFYCMNVNKYWMRFLWYAETSRSGRPRPWLFRISQEPNPIIVFIIQCFEENNDKNTEPCFNGCVPNAPAILDKIKWNSKPPSPPPPTPKARMKAREGQKRAIFPSLIWGRGEGLGFPFILSKIVALVILSLLLEIMLWASNLAYL